MTQKFEGRRGVFGPTSSVSEGYSIEVADEMVGVVVREPGERCFTFVAAVKAFNALEGRQFRSPLEAERAARAHLAARRQKGRAARRVLRRRETVQEQCVWSAHSERALVS
jgi:hypothetical protein